MCDFGRTEELASAEQFTWFYVAATSLRNQDEPPTQASALEHESVCTILVVEDHVDSRETIADLLRVEGHTCHEAANGREAIDWLIEQAEPPCLILLDLRMPVMDGWDFLQALGEGHRWAGIPVIVVSATVQDRAPVPVLPAKAFWSKPPDAARIATVHRYCQQHRDSREPAI